MKHRGQEKFWQASGPREKSQNPNPKVQKNPKSQPKQTSNLGYFWDFSLYVIFLGFGIWILGFDQDLVFEFWDCACYNRRHEHQVENSSPPDFWHPACPIAAEHKPISCATVSSAGREGDAR